LALSIIGKASDFNTREFCDKFGINEAQLTKILEDPLFFEEMWDSSLSHIMVPAIPEIIQRWRDRCLTGDTTALKLLLNAFGKTQPEQHAHVHLHKEAKSLEGEALDRKIDELQYKLRSLQKESA
jgi:hypothetical protein